MQLISTTDFKGQITYVNHEFIKISGFSWDELTGRPHNLIRHPDMPPAAFKNLWQTIKAGGVWHQLGKNRCKNGDHYWMDASVTSVYAGDEIVDLPINLHHAHRGNNRQGREPVSMDDRGKDREVAI
ncbi:PAS domain-containing protein [Guyparkeria sp.]|uniref:PAS domain-containing protein n=1 Tax=Guyparkeria sp. TaxID=2035736 RepID=UPI003970E6A5